MSPWIIVRVCRRVKYFWCWVPPAVWEVWREGHNLVSSDERRAALEGMLAWIKHGTFITARAMNVFLPHDPRARLRNTRPQPLGGSLGPGSGRDGVALHCVCLGVCETFGSLHVDAHAYAHPTHMRVPHATQAPLGPSTQNRTHFNNSMDRHPHVYGLSLFFSSRFPASLSSRYLTMVLTPTPLAVLML